MSCINRFRRLFLIKLSYATLGMKRQYQIANPDENASIYKAYSAYLDRDVTLVSLTSLVSLVPRVLLVSLVL